MEDIYMSGEELCRSEDKAEKCRTYGHPTWGRINTLFAVI